MTSTAELPCYTIINAPLDGDIPTEQQLKKDMMDSNIELKVAALKKTIILMLNGEKLPSLLMSVIQYVMPQKDHTLKKLLLLYWELVPKTSPDGKLLRELILVCDSYRKDLQHPNEFIRGSTLRFLCKLKVPELLEPVMPAIRACLEHRHMYVRRNAVLAIFTIYKNSENLIPDAPELIYNFLVAETDLSCKRNAFMMLVHADQERAIEYLVANLDQLQSFGDILQLIIVELINKVARSSPSERSRFIKCVFALLNSQSPAVRYEAAGTLVLLSTAPTAVKAAASAYIDLIVKESDNNVKLVVLDRLRALSKNPAHEKIMEQQVVMDVLRVLAAPDLEVRRKTLEFVMDLLTVRNVEDVVQFLKKEVTKTQNEEGFEKMGEYRQLLIRALHKCGVKFPNIAASVVPLLMDFIADGGSVSGATDVILFVREAVERLPEMRASILAKLLESFHSVRSPVVGAASLWIAGEYSVSTESIESTMREILNALGELPLVESELRLAAGTENSDPNGAGADSAAPAPSLSAPKRLVASDGTYITQSALTSNRAAAASSGGSSESKPALRAMYLGGDFSTAPVLASTLTKLALRFRDATARESASAAGAAKSNAFSAQCMLVLASVLHLGRSGLCAAEMDEDVYDRLMSCIRVLAEPNDPVLAQIFEQDCHRAFVDMLHMQRRQEEEAKELAKKKVQVHVDDLIEIRQLKVKGANESAAMEDDVESSLSRATGTDSAGLATAIGGGGSGSGSSGEGASALEFSKLNRVFQLTGFSDPIYAEAYVTVNQYDIVLDVLVVNQTSDTLQNLTLELSTMSDLKLGEKPSTHNVGPHDFVSIRASIKVSSTETGTIFGNVVYDIAGSAAQDRNCVVLNDIHIDIMDYIVPTTCSDEEFRSMWASFDWENSLAVYTTITSLVEYLKYFEKITNMKTLTTESALTNDVGILVANLAAKSLFGEDALANLSVERTTDGRISGRIRIRSRTQGIAVALGKKITFSQSNVPQPIAPKPQQALDESSESADNADGPKGDESEA